MRAVDGPTRRDPLPLLVVAAVLLALRVGTGVFEAANPGVPVELVDWQPIAAADSLASATGKPVLYDFSAEWCGPCQVMQREVFSEEKAAEVINALFVPVRVVDRQQEDGRNLPEVDALERRFEIQSFPTLVVLPRTGPPRVQRGYSGAQRTVSWLTQAAMSSRGAPAPAPVPGGP